MSGHNPTLEQGIISCPRCKGKGTVRQMSELAAPTLLSCGVESEDSTCERCGGQGWYPWYDSHEHEIQQPCEACNGTGRVAKRQPQDNAAGER